MKHNLGLPHISIFHKQLFVGVWIIGIAIRLAIARHILWFLDYDEALNALQAFHIYSRGIHPLLWYGQSYMGSFESHLIALAISLFGTSVLAVRVVPLLFSAAFPPAMYLLGKRMSHHQHVPLYCLVFSAMGTPFFTVWELKARGGFIEVLVLSVLLLAYVIQSERLSLQKTFFVGGACGFLWWTCPLSTISILCIALLIFYTTRKLAQIIMFPSGFFLGASPLIYANLKAEANTVQWLQEGNTNLLERLASNLHNVITNNLWQLMGIGLGKHTTEGETMLSSALLLGWFVAIIAALWIILRTTALPQLRIARAIIVAIHGLLLPLLMALSWWGIQGAPRYFMPFVIAAFPAGAILLHALETRKWGKIAVLVLLSTVLLSYAWGSYRLMSFPRPPWEVQGKPVPRVSDLITCLQQHKIRAIYGKRGLTYLVGYLTGEKIRGCPPISDTRDFPFTANKVYVEKAARFAYVFSYEPVKERALRRAVIKSGVRCQKIDLRDYTIYTHFSKPAHPEDIQLEKHYQFVLQRLRKHSTRGAGGKGKTEGMKRLKLPI